MVDEMYLSFSLGEWVHIGDVKVQATSPGAPELVPRLYGNGDIYV